MIQFECKSKKHALIRNRYELSRNISKQFAMLDVCTHGAYIYIYIYTLYTEPIYHVD